MKTWQFVTVLAALLALAGLGESCSCQKLSFKEKLCKSDYVLRVGIVGKDDDKNDQMVYHIFRPLVSYKGDINWVTGDFNVRARKDAAACGVPNLPYYTEYIVGFTNATTTMTRGRLTKCDLLYRPHSLSKADWSQLYDLSVGNLKCKAGCKANGKSYEDGWQGIGPDGCNTCRCRDGAFSCSKNVCPKGCVVNKTIVAEGWSGIGPDGCNNCSCTDKSLVCTLKMCVKDTCTVNGTEVAKGWSGIGSDGCNTCKCEESGRLACTKKACPEFCTVNGTAVANGWQGIGPDGCNTCACADGKLACTLRECV